jgi:hypothetical protein
VYFADASCTQGSTLLVPSPQLPMLPTDLFSPAYRTQRCKAGARVRRSCSQRSSAATPGSHLPHGRQPVGGLPAGGHDREWHNVPNRTTEPERRLASVTATTGQAATPITTFAPASAGVGEGVRTAFSLGWQMARPYDSPTISHPTPPAPLRQRDFQFVGEQPIGRFHQAWREIRTGTDDARRPNADPRNLPRSAVRREEPDTTERSRDTDVGEHTKAKRAPSPKPRSAKDKLASRPDSGVP